MKKIAIIKELIRLADYLDDKKLGKEANFVDSIIKSASKADAEDDEDVDMEVGSLETRVNRLTRLVEEMYNKENSVKDMENY